MKIPLRCAGAIVVLGVVFGVGCAGGDFSPPPKLASIQIATTATEIRASQTQQFTATGTGTTNNAIVWSVNGLPGGTATVGQINSAGLYTAPATLPENNVVEVQAANGFATAKVRVALLNPVPIVESVAAQNEISAALLITGQHFVSGASVKVDGVAVPTTFISEKSLTASAPVLAAQRVEISVANPDPGAANSPLFTFVGRPTRPSRSSYSNGAARFLDQASFGPTAAEINNVRTFPGGLPAYIDNQFTLLASPWTIPTQVPLNNGNNLCQADNLVRCLQILWFQNALQGQDQLRQRTAFALSQIWVVSGNTVTFGDSYQTYYTILNNDAFSTYDTIIRDVTLSSAMGFYLDMGNSAKPTDPTQIANENYARELLQLFTVGLYLLNDDGTYQLDGNSNPVPTYTEDDIQQFAKALTGWTFKTKVGAQSTTQSFTSNADRTLPMLISTAAKHDTSAKTLLLNTPVPAGQDATADLNAVVANVFNHPNLPPFICKQLIQHLVMSNPSPAYVGRISAIFKDNGTQAHTRGDMKAVIKAILLDTEARQGDAYVSNDNSGHLREPVLAITAIVRGLGTINTQQTTTYTAANNSGSMTNLAAPLVSVASNMGQDVLFAPSVFNYFPPDNVIPGSNNLGPEFLVFTTATSPQRANFVDNVVRNINQYVNTGVSFSGSIAAYAAMNPDAMVNALDQAFTYGQMSAVTKAAIIGSIAAMPGTTQNDLTFRARRAIYLVLSSSQYQLIH